MTDREALETAKAKCSAGWVQGHGAVNKHGEKTRCLSCGAACFCVWGALFSLRLPHVQCGRLMAKLNSMVPGRSVILWNDTPGRTKEEVLDLFDRAIEAEAAT